MAKMRRGNFHLRLATLEHRADQAREANQSRVVIYLPRKDGDTRPAGVLSRTDGVLTVLYDPAQPDPILPDDW
ncbi:MAG: hypothetical protein L0241_14700 [Planctomycetia bacterium]|nr:hypothetical protein [Planctomycetia bacterium]